MAADPTAVQVLKPHIRGIVFDAVGTLIFPEPGAAAVYAECARQHGAICDAADIARRMSTAFRAEEETDRAAGWVTSEGREVERWRRIVAASLPGLADPDACFRDLYDHFARPGAWAVNPEAAIVLTELATRGIAFGLASNYDSRLFRVLAGHPALAAVQDRVVVSSVVGHRKPSPIFFECVVQTMSVAVGELMLVGDDFENDYRGAAASGMSAVLFDERNRHPSAVRVSRLTELLG